MWYDKLVDCDKPNYPDIELSICPKRWSTMCGPWDIWWGPLHEATEIYRSCKHAGSKYRILCITFCTSASVTLAPTVRVREEGHKKSKTFWFLMLVVVCLCSRAGVYLASVLYLPAHVKMWTQERWMWDTRWHAGLSSWWRATRSGDKEMAGLLPKAVALLVSRTCMHWPLLNFLHHCVLLCIASHHLLHQCNNKKALLLGRLKN